MAKIVEAGYGGAAPLKKKKATGSAARGTMVIQPTPTAASTGLAGVMGVIPGSPGSPGTATRTVTPIQVYEDQILGDPGAVAAEGIFTGQKTNLANARADAIKQAVINSGYTPEMTGGLEGYASDLTPSVLEAARANPLSLKAQNDYQLRQGTTNSPYDLAASGMDRSGALAIQLGNLSRQHEATSYGHMQNLLGTITGAVNTYAGGFNEAQSSLAAARREIADRLARQAGYSETITTTGAEDPTEDEEVWLPSSNPNQLSPSYPAPVINKVVQKAIKSMGFKAGKKAPADIYRTLKQTILAG